MESWNNGFGRKAVSFKEIISASTTQSSSIPIFKHSNHLKKVQIMPSGLSSKPGSLDPDLYFYLLYLNLLKELFSQMKSLADLKVSLYTSL